MVVYQENLAMGNIILRGILFISGIISLLMSFSSFKRKRLIQNIPTSKIRAIAMGLVEIFGEAVQSQTLFKCPFSGKDAVYYNYTVEELKQRGKHSEWVAIFSKQENAPFFVQDDTGKVLVDPKDAEISISPDFNLETGGLFGKALPEKLEQFLKENNVAYKTFLGNKRLKFTEYSIAPKDKVYVLGTAGDNPHVGEASATEHVGDIMIQKGKYEKFYYISDKSEKDVVKKIMWQAIITLILGAAFIIGGVALIL